jgi:hypothetical protein
VAKAADEFGRAEYTIRVTSDAELTRQMQKSEAAISGGLKPISAAFDQTSTSVATTQGKVASAGQVFGAFGAQASALGGVVGGVGGKVAALGSAFASMGSAVLGLPAIILGLTAVFGGLVSSILSARERSREFVASLGEIKNSVAELGAGFEASLVTISQQLITIDSRDPFEQAVSATTLKMAQLDQRVAAVGRSMDAIREQRRELEESIAGLPFYAFERKEAEKLFPEFDKQLEKGRNVLRELGVLRILTRQEGDRTIEQLAEDRRRQELVNEQTHARNLMEARRREFAAFQQTPMGKVLQAGFDIMGERRERAQIESILESIPTPFKFLERFVEDIRARVLGGSAADPRAGRAGFVELPALATSGRGVPGAGFVDPHEVQRRQQEADRTRYAKETAVATTVIARKRVGTRP